jgi:hypothetical protein
MSASIALVLLFANAPTEHTTMPRRPDPTLSESQLARATADPLFDNERVGTDPQAFVLSAIEAARQGEVDADIAAAAMSTPALREAATRIGRQNEVTRTRLAEIADRKGWRLPRTNDERSSTLPETGELRTAANFIIQQIPIHEAMVAQFRAQMAGEGDEELQRALGEILPGYQKNLELLLHLKL